MENKKKISVVIPVYNRPEEIDELLDSMIRQDTKPDWEVVVVEDGSQVTSEQVYGRQQKTQLGSETLYKVTDQILKENIEKGNIKES